MSHFIQFLHKAFALSIKTKIRVHSEKNEFNNPPLNSNKEKTTYHSSRQYCYIFGHVIKRNELEILTVEDIIYFTEKQDDEHQQANIQFQSRNSQYRHYHSS